MIERCSSAIFKNYKGRGIKVCDRWLRIENFIADMGYRPSKEHTIERIDNDGNYEPKNCRWATKAEQSRNTRRNRMLTYRGRTMCVVDWAVEIGVNHRSLFKRIAKGWTGARLFSGKDSLRAPKVTEAMVREIRRRKSEGEQQRLIALDLGLSEMTVSRVVRGAGASI